MVSNCRRKQKQRPKERLHSEKISDRLIELEGSCDPIIVEGIAYFNRRQLLLLGVTPEDYELYFRLTAIKVIANGGHINLLTRVSDYQDFVKFIDINAKFFINKNK